MKSRIRIKAKIQEGAVEAHNGGVDGGAPWTLTMEAWTKGCKQQYGKPATEKDDSNQ
jgi:hypothetical protein